MSQRSPWSVILWDMDGTIVDASDGILRRLGIAMRRLGHPEISRGELVHWIGPPMFESFQVQLGMTPAQAADAVTLYREIGLADGYTTGARLFEGVGRLIAEVHAAGVPQAIASSKPENQVLALCEHFGLTPYFRAIVGASPDERSLSAKADIVAEALRRLETARVDTDRPVLIGDRHHDVEGGAANGMPVIFVRWGFGWPHEAADAQLAVDDIAQLRAALLVGDVDG